MISETKLLDKLDARLDAYIEGCDPLMSLKADGYAKCYKDVVELIEELAQENKIKAAARRAAKKLLAKKGAMINNGNNQACSAENERALRY